MIHFATPHGAACGATDDVTTVEADRVTCEECVLGHSATLAVFPEAPAGVNLLAPGVWLRFCVQAWREVYDLTHARLDDGAPECADRAAGHLRRLSRGMTTPVIECDTLDALHALGRIMRACRHDARGFIFVEVERAEHALAAARENARRTP